MLIVFAHRKIPLRSHHHEPKTTGKNDKADKAIKVNKEEEAYCILFVAEKTENNDNLDVGFPVPIVEKLEQLV